MIGANRRNAAMSDAGFLVPPLSCDCHMHIFGDPADYPASARRAYDPIEMPLSRYNAEAARMGFGRVVFVQPSAYGTDNACMLDSLRARPGSSRGVAVIDDNTTAAMLDEMDELGVRGVRLNLVSSGEPDGTAAIGALQAAAARVARLGWHVQIFAKPDLLGLLAPVIATLAVPVVVDHMGGGTVSPAGSDPAFSALLDLLAAGKCWVKISGANRVSAAGGDFADALPVMRALVAANPERVVWGTDWPHIGPHTPGDPKPVVYMPIDNLALLRLLGQAVPDAATRRRILVDNPAALYGFTTT
jgi:predicted TIM-barrel fold metal-dependent hydrolase